MERYTPGIDFLIASTLTTASGLGVASVAASVVLENGAQAGNVFWQVGSAATLGTYTSFYGAILASQSIALDTGANMTGRALALNGAVTLDGNQIIVPVPEPASLWSGVFTASFVGIWQCMALWRRKAVRS
jgi:hypothetical protein